MNGHAARLLIRSLEMLRLFPHGEVCTCGIDDVAHDCPSRMVCELEQDIESALRAENDVASAGEACSPERMEQAISAVAPDTVRRVGTPKDFASDPALPNDGDGLRPNPPQATTARNDALNEIRRGFGMTGIKDDTKLNGLTAGAWADIMARFAASQRVDTLSEPGTDGGKP